MHSSLRTFFGVRFFLFLIQSSTHEPHVLKERIEEFLSDFEAVVLNDISEEKFSNFVQAAILHFDPKHLKLSDETLSLWTRISDFSYDFGKSKKTRRSSSHSPCFTRLHHRLILLLAEKQVVAFMQQITKAELIRFFRQNVIEQSRTIVGQGERLLSSRYLFDLSSLFLI